MTTEKHTLPKDIAKIGEEKARKQTNDLEKKIDYGIQAIEDEIQQTPVFSTIIPSYSMDIPLQSFTNTVETLLQRKTNGTYENTRMIPKTITGKKYSLRFQKDEDAYTVTLQKNSLMTDDEQSYTTNK